MTTFFYSGIPSFDKFSEACNPEHYYPVPDSWYVIVADVEGSTKAIEAGRYKDVNMVGAACIVAAINCCPGVEIPFVFGGDGATILVPPQYVESVKNELNAVKHTASAFHLLKLRIGAVPVSTIRKQGKELLVAKYMTSHGFRLAMYRGGGALLADRLVKENGYEIDCGEVFASPNLSGLSCRWKPIQSKKDSILTLLILSTDQDEDDCTYQQINQVLAEILGEDGNPVSPENMIYSWPSIESLRQSQMVWRQGEKLKNLTGHLFMVGFFNFLNRFNINVGTFDPMRYQRALIANSDYRKFDDMLRMVVDCTNSQLAEIERRLVQWRGQNKIVYGTHSSQTALMTCFVMTTNDDSHVHFIDGNHGGYTLAAKRLKSQLVNMPQDKIAA